MSQLESLEQFIRYGLNYQVLDPIRRQRALAHSEEKEANKEATRKKEAINGLMLKELNNRVNLLNNDSSEDDIKNITDSIDSARVALEEEPYWLKSLDLTQTHLKSVGGRINKRNAAYDDIEGLFEQIEGRYTDPDLGAGLKDLDRSDSLESLMQDLETSIDLNKDHLDRTDKRYFDSLQNEAEENTRIYNMFKKIDDQSHEGFSNASKSPMFKRITEDAWEAWKLGDNKTAMSLFRQGNKALRTYEVDAALVNSMKNKYVDPETNSLRKGFENQIFKYTEKNQFGVTTVPSMDYTVDQAIDQIDTWTELGQPQKAISMLSQIDTYMAASSAANKKQKKAREDDYKALVNNSLQVGTANTAYLEDIEQWGDWVQNNESLLNIKKTLDDLNVNFKSKAIRTPENNEFLLKQINTALSDLAYEGDIKSQPYFANPLSGDKDDKVLGELFARRETASKVIKKEDYPDIYDERGNFKPYKEDGTLNVEPDTKNSVEKLIADELSIRPDYFLQDPEALNFGTVRLYSDELLDKEILKNIDHLIKSKSALESLLHLQDQSNVTPNLQKTIPVTESYEEPEIPELDTTSADIDTSEVDEAEMEAALDSLNLDIETLNAVSDTGMSEDAVKFFGSGKTKKTTAPVSDLDSLSEAEIKKQLEMQAYQEQIARFADPDSPFYNPAFAKNLEQFQTDR